MKHKRVKGVLHYLVRWTVDGRSWVPQGDITQAASDAYYVKRHQKVRRKRKRRL